MVIFVMLKWYKLLYNKEILSIYWMTLVPHVSQKKFTSPLTTYFNINYIYTCMYTLPFAHFLDCQIFENE